MATATVPPKVQNYITISQLARRLDIPFKKANRLILESVFRPDATLDCSPLFLESRLPELAMLKARFDSVLSHGIGDEK
jgi:hypothetical protein